MTATTAMLHSNARVRAPLRAIALVTALASLALLGACSDRSAVAAVQPEAPAPSVQGNQIRYAPNHPQLAMLGVTAAVPSRAVRVELPARLVWNEERTQRLYPAFAGRVSAIEADVGSRVKRGSTLARLASPDFGIAQADTAKAQADARLSAANLQRQRELFDAGIVARKDLEQAYLAVLATMPEPQQPSLETRAIVLEALTAIDAMLDGLKPKVRAVFILAQIEGHAYADIAAQLGIGERSVKRYMAEALTECVLLAQDLPA